MSNFKALTENATFIVRYSSTCGDDCDCTDNCPTNTESAELNALQILTIGQGGDNEWIEEVREKITGKVVSLERIKKDIKLLLMVPDEPFDSPVKVLISKNKIDFGKHSLCSTLTAMRAAPGYLTSKVICDIQGKPEYLEVIFEANESEVAASKPLPSGMRYAYITHQEYGYLTGRAL